MEIDDTRPGRPDRVGLYVAIGWVAIGAVLAIVAAVNRLREVAPGRGIPVVVPLPAESASLPLGPDGAAVKAAVESATVIVDDPSGATLFALWAQPLWIAVVACTAMVLSALFFLRLARGLAFSRGAARIVFVGAGLVMVHWVVDSILTGMATTGALAAISDDSYKDWTLTFSLTPIFGILVLAATGAALQIGERLQRETAGLV